MHVFNVAWEKKQEEQKKRSEEIIYLKFFFKMARVRQAYVQKITKLREFQDQLF